MRFLTRSEKRRYAACWAAIAVTFVITFFPDTVGMTLLAHIPYLAAIIITVRYGTNINLRARRRNAEKFFTDVNAAAAAAVAEGKFQGTVLDGIDVEATIDHRSRGDIALKVRYWQKGHPQRFPLTDNWGPTTTTETD